MWFPKTAWNGNYWCTFSWLCGVTCFEYTPIYCIHMKFSSKDPSQSKQDSQSRDINFYFRRRQQNKYMSIPKMNKRCISRCKQRNCTYNEWMWKYENLRDLIALAWFDCSQKYHVFLTINTILISMNSQQYIPKTSTQVEKVSMFIRNIQVCLFHFYFWEKCSFQNHIQPNKFKRHWTVENCVIQETPKHLCAAACTKEQNSGSVRKAFTHLNFLSLYYCEQKQCIAIFNVESFAIFIRWTKIILQYKLTVLNCVFFSSQFVRSLVGSFERFKFSIEQKLTLFQKTM